jgi:hypothetical protein
MAIKIEQKIVSAEVVRERPAPGAALQQMDERIQRPEQLSGRTYKLKTPLTEHALFVTINDIVLNPGTPHEQHRPFEIFINSKSMEHFQWIVALTRIISAVFRKGGDCTFLAEELRSVFDPRGGYIRRGGRFVPSLVAEIGDVIETHLRSIGLLDEQQLDEHQRAYIEQKRAELERQSPATTTADDAYPAGAQICGKCNTQAMIQMDNCLTCLSCGESKCG